MPIQHLAKATKHTSAITHYESHSVKYRYETARQPGHTGQIAEHITNRPKLKKTVLFAQY